MTVPSERLCRNHACISFALWAVVRQLSLSWVLTSPSNGYEICEMSRREINWKQPATKNWMLSLQVAAVTIPNWTETHQWIGKTGFYTRASLGARIYPSYPGARRHSAISRYLTFCYIFRPGHSSGACNLSFSASIRLRELQKIAKNLLKI